MITAVYIEDWVLVDGAVYTHQMQNNVCYKSVKFDLF